MDRGCTAGDDDCVSGQPKCAVQRNELTGLGMSVSIDIVLPNHEWVVFAWRHPKCLDQKWIRLVQIAEPNVPVSRRWRALFYSYEQPIRRRPGALKFALGDCLRRVGESRVIYQHRVAFNADDNHVVHPGFTPVAQMLRPYLDDARRPISRFVPTQTARPDTPRRPCPIRQAEQHVSQAVPLDGS